MTQETPLAGRVALVTGAARRRGIGRGIALVLARSGADVAVNDVAEDEQGAERVREVEALGRRAVFVNADVRDPEAVRRMFDTAEEALGPVEVFVNNAGVCVWQNVREVDREAFDLIMGVNLAGALLCCREAAQRMVRRGRGGRIVIISSVHAQMPFPRMAVYGATKNALRALSDHLALELAPHGITVNHVGPGWVDSDINLASPDLRTQADRQRTLDAIPLHRPAEPEDIGAAVSFLASDAAAYVTGAFLRVDGGFVVGKYTRIAEVAP